MSIVIWKRLITNMPRVLDGMLGDITQRNLLVQLQVGGLDKVVNRIVYGLVTTATILASAMLWSANVPPRLFDVSVIGISGTVFGMLLAMRLLYAIHRSGGV